MAQMVARNIGSVEVTGSIPVASFWEAFEREFECFFVSKVKIKDCIGEYKTVLSKQDRFVLPYLRWNIYRALKSESFCE